MNAQTNELDGHIKNVMAQIAEAASASKPDLAAIQRLTRKAAELQEMKEQMAAIHQRIASLNSESTDVPPLTPNQPTNGKIRQLLIEVTAGMLRQNLLTLAPHARSGKIKVGEELIIEAQPSGERFQTVLLEQGKKLRARGEIASFYRDAKVKDGDYVLLTEVTPGRWTLKKAPPGVYGISRSRLLQGGW
jgi:Asp-tRNA(Asn)/Glu-tRNA(Gln) amidotransferase C subunit